VAAVSVRVDTGPIEATHPIQRVAKERWADLVQVRRTFLAIRLPYDCRCLLQFVEEAAEMIGPLGYGDTTDFLRRGLALDPPMVEWALQGLQRLKPDEPIPFQRAVELGRRGRPTKEEQRAHKDYPIIFKQGTSSTYLLARLDRDYPELAARVRAGELKPKTAARQAGIIREKTFYEQLQRLWLKVTPDDRAAFLQWVSAPR
jgi:hypothetical protein